MQRLRPDIDIIKEVLETVLTVKPSSNFVQSLLIQYQERGGLSKKQLQGLYDIATKTGKVPAPKMATLEAIIRKKAAKTRSELPEATPLYMQDVETGKKIDAILIKYPQHKRVLFLKAKFDNHEPFTSVESTELAKFYKMLK